MTSNAERNAMFLHEMGLGPIWTPRVGPSADRGMPSIQDHAVSTADTANAAITFAADVPSAWAEDVAQIPVPMHAPIPEQASVASHAVSDATIAAMSWDELRQAAATCTRCGLCRNRTNAVFGVGDEKAQWLFVGEGPGRNEDLQGLPFIGPAGKLLDSMMVAMNMRRGVNTYIANIVKCRPTDENGRDRAPTQQEAAACLPYLQRQIALIQPQMIVALGKTAALTLLGADPATPVSKLRGTVHQYADRPLVVTYHPAYLLRSPVEKRKTWTDLCLAMATHANAG